MADEDRARDRLISAQRRAIRRLKDERGLTLNDIASLTHSTEKSARNWLYGVVLARAATRLLLAEAAESGTSSPPARTTARGRTGRKGLSARDRLLGECEMDTPRRRARALKRMIDDLQITREDFARLIQVHPTTLYDYLDEANEAMPALEVVRRLRRLRRDHASGRQPETLLERFHRAARKIFGEAVYERGFTGRSAERAEIVVRLAAQTGMSKRMLYRLMPPYDRTFRPKMRVVLGFESAARKAQRR